MKEKAKSLAMSASSNSVSVLFGQEGEEEVKHMNSTLSNQTKHEYRQSNKYSKSNLPMVLLLREFDGDVVVEHRKDGNLHRGQNRRRRVSIGSTLR